jgi:uncharacterized repeat protein (TIGR01451 family)
LLSGSLPKFTLAVLTCAAAAFAQNPATTVTIDASANPHAINPLIYGVAFGDATTLPDLNSPVNRYGGNNSSRYNWQVNADNRAQDWYFESIGDNSAIAGERGDTFFSASRAGGAQAMLTIPMIGWVAKLGAGRNKLSSFSIAKYGAQTGNDWQWFPDAGNGVLSSTGQNVTGNDPNEANVPADSTYQQAWVQHLVTGWGKAANGGVGYYLLDNESSIWFSTHRDVHPTGPTMDEIKTKIVDYSAKIKAVDPTAQVVGPEEWGWSGYFYSGYDQQYGSLHNWSSFPDRANHGGQDYLPWLLGQLKQTALSTGQPPLNVFSVHYYPQGGEFGNDTSMAMQLRRNRSTRSLWDPNYVDESWINDKVELIPRLKNWVSAYYLAGTPVAVTEYNWGAESHINGATAQADILGIFGREGLDMAARWTTPDPSTPTYKAMKMYRNYDGNKAGFGDTSVAAAVANPDNLSAFAAVRSSDGALTAMVISKVLTGATPVTLALNNFAGTGAAQVYQLTSANSIQHLSNVTYTGTSLNASVPAQSITLFVLPKSAAVSPSLSIVKAHTGNFTQGQRIAAYTVTVSNAANAGATSGTVTVSETAPASMSVVSMSGIGWTCAATCTRSDVLNPGSSYPPITVTVNVAAHAGSPQVNVVSVTGGGSAPATASDSTTIVPAGTLIGFVDMAGDAQGGATLAKGATLYVGGWAADTALGAPVQTVTVFVDGVSVGTATLGIARPDVAQVFTRSDYTNSGWSFQISTAAFALGQHSITAKAGTTALVGTRTINLTAAGGQQIGFVDMAGDAQGGATVAKGATLYVGGWAADTSSGAPVQGVTVLIDGSNAGSATLGAARPDVAQAFSRADFTNSGWSFLMSTAALSVGQHSVAALAGTTPLIKTLTVTVTAGGGQEIGYVDMAGDAQGGPSVSQTGTLYVGGWAADTVAGAPVQTVTVFLDGNSIGTATLGGARPDVAQTFSRSDYTNSGWSLQISAGNLSTGQHSVTAAATGSSGFGPLLRSRTLNVTP